METGDKVMVLLCAKAVCCGALALAATGALGGVGAWLLGGAGQWVVPSFFVAAIAAIVLLPRRRGTRRPAHRLHGADSRRSR